MVKVLVVDDEPEIAEMFADTLDLRGFATLKANGVEDALAVLRREAVDVVLSDINMGAKSGIDLLVAADALNRPRPVFILMSGNSDISLGEVLGNGGYALFSKPIRTDVLVDAINGAASLKSGSRRNERFSVSLDATDLSRSQTWKVQNLSRGGGLISGEGLPGPGKLLKVVLHGVDTPYGEIVLEGAVRWVSGGAVGVEWIKSASSALGGDLRFWNDLHTRVFKRD